MFKKFGFTKKFVTLGKQNISIMNTVSKNWNDLPDLIDVHELSENDDQCLKQLQAVIEKYNLTSKFGVALLHKHFDIENDEVLLETNDPKLRTLTTRPIRIKEGDSQNYATTIWRFSDGNRYGCAFCKKNHCDTSDM